MTARGPAYSIRPFPHPRRVAAGAGIISALAAAGLGAMALMTVPSPVQTESPGLQPITVPSPPAVLPLAGTEILALLDRSPDFGTLDDPRRRALCLAGLGYPAATRVLGARPVEVGGRRAVLLVLPGEQTGTVVALAVAPNCSSADTGLLADTTVQRP